MENRYLQFPQTFHTFVFTGFSNVEDVVGNEISLRGIGFIGRQKRHETDARFLGITKMFLKFKSLGVKLFLFMCSFQSFERQCFKISRTTRPNTDCHFPKDLSLQN
jgi:hypothetical protein